MTRDCSEFRARLAEALRRPASTEGGPLRCAAGALAWHAHVIHCAECRELLAEEEALDELLRSLPEPRLPRALAERVLSRLDGARHGVDLDRLLDLSRPEPVPAELARKVLARVHAEQRLDRLLDRLPAEVPAGLDRRVLARLALARRPTPAARPVPVPVLAHAPLRAPLHAPLRAYGAGAHRRLPLRLAAGVALVTLAGWTAWAVRKNLADATRPDDPAIAGVDEPPTGSQPVTLPIPDPDPEVGPGATGALPDEQLLASLEMLEAWDLFAGGAGASATDGSSGIDTTLATLDSLDEYLLEFESSAQATEGTSGPGTPSVPNAPGGTNKSGTDGAVKEG